MIGIHSYAEFLTNVDYTFISITAVIYMSATEQICSLLKINDRQCENFLKITG